LNQNIEKLTMPYSKMISFYVANIDLESMTVNISNSWQILSLVFQKCLWTWLGQISYGITIARNMSKQKIA